MSIEQEWQTFQRELPRLLEDPANQGKYVLIHGDAVDSIWPTLDAGLEAGYNRFGLKPFIVQEINANPEPQFFSRNVKPCR